MAAALELLKLPRVAIPLAIIVVLAAILALWVFLGRQIVMMADRFGAVETESRPIHSIAYQGSGAAGYLMFEGVPLGLNLERNSWDDPVRLEQNKDRQLVLSTRDKTFLLGPLRENHSGSRGVDVEPGDDARLVLQRSAISWPTPFDFNFMTGHSPSWKRHAYYQLVWKKPDGRKLTMRWRFEQYFYGSDGWTRGLMTHEGSTGLIHVEIDGV